MRVSNLEDQSTTLCRGVPIYFDGINNEHVVGRIECSQTGSDKGFDDFLGYKASDVLVSRCG